MATLNIASLNAHGIRDKHKRKGVICHLKETHFDIFVFKSPTSQTVKDMWKSEWGGDMIYSVGSSHSEGQVILIKKGFQFEWQIVLISDRVLIVKVNTEMGDVYIANMYAPNSVSEKMYYLRRYNKK